MRRILPLLLVLAATAPAQADVIMSPTMACPTGSITSTSHSGEWCAPTTCERPADCREGFTCERASVCIAEETYQPGGLGASPEPQTREVAVAACGSQADCPANSVCREARRCVPASVITVLDPANIGCDCTVAATRRGAGSAVWISLALMLSLCIRRRRIPPARGGHRAS